MRPVFTVKAFLYPLICIGLSLAAFLYYYPTYPTVHDELIYLSYAFVLRQGCVFADSFSFLPGLTEHGGHFIFKYPPGLPLLLAPLCSHWEDTFTVNLLWFLAGGIVFTFLLLRFRIATFWSWLYFFFPPFILYSRTLMSDIPAMVCILVSFLLLTINGRSNAIQFCAGIALASSVIFRYASVIYAPCFLMWLIFCKQPICFFLFGFLSLSALLTSYLWLLQGNPLSTPYLSGGGVGHLFSVSYVPSHFPLYLGTLLLIYPGLLVSLCISCKQTPRGFIALSGIASILVWSSYYYVQTGATTLLSSMVTASRFILPVQALLLVHYAGVLDDISRKLSMFTAPRLRLALCISTITVAIFVSISIHSTHFERVELYRKLAQEIHSNLRQDGVIIVNQDATRLLNPFWASPHQTLINLASILPGNPAPEQARSALINLCKKYPNSHLQLILLDRPPTVWLDTYVAKQRSTEAHIIMSEFSPDFVLVDCQLGPFHLLMEEASSEHLRLRLRTQRSD